MRDGRTLLLAAVLGLGLSGPALAFQCPTMIADIDAALAEADLTDEQRQEVEALRDEGERLHSEGQHDDSVETLTQAKAILGIE